ncbi:hypothetical protein P691DRAFT_667963 [Macrolepiota fuliginosa MF-IS2]|uniref:Uncharacterized protein n=1 Tax=Macrolepiota fuliginosa MF-IS2 TaxID=1400762 RepID=A0A9P5XGM2_9AGAR|nr:hypothetical protein P691DRAFT_667963 [Macrolepiota fuliginosa MF-IS2]
MGDVDTATSAPVLSFPAILRNPGLKDRYAHLRGGNIAGQDQGIPGQIVFKKIRRDQNEGKRWIRRRDNAHFVGNPHVVSASRKDYTPPTPSNKPTFPEPLPSYLPRSVKVPVATIPTRDPGTASAGRFSLSMKGMRKELRRSGGRAESLVQDIEEEMMEWLQGGVMLRPDESNAAGLANLQVKSSEGREIGSTGSIVEVSRTPLQLVWSITDDAFARYVVHCCARYHEVVSFSKGGSDGRLTYLLRPNVHQPDYRATTTLETPPITDIDYSSHPETTDVDSDLVSDHDFTDSDVDDPIATGATSGNLDSIQETSLPSSPHITRKAPNNPVREDDEWSVVSADVDAYGDESGSEAGRDLLDSISSLNLGGEHDPVSETRPPTNEAEGEDDDPDKTMTQEIAMVPVEGRESSPVRVSHLHQPLYSPNRRWARSTSSPSRSPARTRRLVSARKKRQVANLRMGSMGKHISFYDYLFS